MTLVKIAVALLAGLVALMMVLLRKRRVDAHQLGAVTARCIADHLVD
jgi:hypothetical protein